MPKRKSTPIDAARQALSRLGTSTRKKSIRALTKKRKTLKASLDREYVAQWRVLKKLGLISTKNNPSAKNLTGSIKTKINREFKNIQKSGYYKTGKVHRPLIRTISETKTGKKITKYHLDNQYKLIKTKRKINVKTGITKSKKGYIVDTGESNGKVKINNDGSITISTKERKVMKKGYTGNQIMRLVELIEDDKFHIKDDQVLMMRQYGSVRTERGFENDSLEELAETIRHYEKNFTREKFNEWKNYTEIVIVEDK